MYKKFKRAEQARRNAEQRGSRYLDDYKQKERIAQLEYKLKEKEETEDNDRAYRLLSDFEY